MQLVLLQLRVHNPPDPGHLLVPQQTRSGRALMMTISVCFTNFGPYHLARLRALARRLAQTGDRLLAIEVADHEQRYPWSRASGSEPFQWTTLFPGRALETISREECNRAMRRLLEAERPDALGIVGLRPTRVHGRAQLGQEERSADDPDVREPGDRPPANLVEGSREASESHPLLERPRRRSPAPRLPGQARDGPVEDRPRLQRGRQRGLRRPRRGCPTLDRRSPRSPPSVPTSWRSTALSPRRT